MAKLEDFQEAAFNQNDHLTSTFKWKKDSAGGVCLSLCVRWYRLLMEGKVRSADGIIKALIKDFNLALVGQSVFDDSLRGVGSATSVELATKWNTISTVTGIEFALDSDGHNIDPFTVALYGLGDGAYLLRLFFAEGAGHAIGFMKVQGMYMFFDPNLGMFGMGSDKDVKIFSGLLWLKYKVDFGLNVSVWQLFNVTEAQTARQKMVAALAKLT